MTWMRRSTSGLSFATPTPRDVLRFAIAAFALCIPCAAVATAQTPTFDGVVYAQHGTNELKLDIHLPTTGTAPYPAVFWIHGGSWRTGSRVGIGVSAGLLERGIAVVSVDYRLTQSGWEGVDLLWPAQIHDVKGAVRFIRANAATYSIDPNRLGAWGPSSGAHLATILAMTANDPFLEGDTGGNLSFSSHVSCAVDYYGPTNLMRLALDVTDPPGADGDHDAPWAGEAQLIGWDQPGQGIGDVRANEDNPNAPYPELVAAVVSASPVTYPSADDPPLFIAHGTDDSAYPILQSEALAQACAAAGMVYEYHAVPGAGHGSLGGVTNRAAWDFVVSHLRDPCPSDLDQSGLVDFQDLNLVLLHWGTSHATSDINGDGGVDFDDLIELLAAWSAGCSP